MFFNTVEKIVTLYAFISYIIKVCPDFISQVVHIFISMKKKSSHKVMKKNVVIILSTAEACRWCWCKFIPCPAHADTPMTHVQKQCMYPQRSLMDLLYSTIYTGIHCRTRLIIINKLLYHVIAPGHLYLYCIYIRHIYKY